MNQDSKPAPFNVGDHVHYIAARRRELARGRNKETVLVPGMVGVILLSTGAFAGQTTASPRPWRCQVQFENGFRCDITPENRADFASGASHGSKRRA